MPIRFVLLWTDALLGLLVVVGVVGALYARRREHLRAPWRYVVRNALGMGALIILSAYVTVGLLDSVHFRRALPGAPGAPVDYSTEVVSLLDLAVLPLKEQVEKTYSAPFATHLYTKETVERPDGTQTREYPRLRYGGAHLADPAADRTQDIARTTLRAGGEAALAWALLAALIAARHARRTGRPWRIAAGQILAGRTDLPWRVILLTLGGLLLAGFLLARLGTRYHVLGTDKVGIDVLYLSLKSIRTGVIIGTLTTLIMLPFAIALGIMAGYFRGWVDDVIQYLYTTLSSIPFVLLIAASILTLQAYMAAHPDLFETTAVRADMRLLFLCIILGITSWTSLCRLLRGETLKLREMEYIQASVGFGARPATIITRHILPNVMHIVLITVALDFSALVLAEAVLSYVGVGVDPTTISWGTMINSARLEMARDPIVWWKLSAAFVFMFTLVLAANLFADVVRDALDPRLSKVAGPT